MSEIELIVEELKTLPPAKVTEAAGYIHHLKAVSETERRAALEKTAGALSPAEADEMARLIEEGCEQIEHRELTICPLPRATITSSISKD